jgi:hypothetical protein
MTKQSKSVVVPGSEADGTYEALAQFGADILRDQGRSQGQVSNFLTALRAWCKHAGRSQGTTFSDDMGASFDKMFLNFQDVESELVSPRTLKDRCEQILWWRKVADQVKGQDLLPPAFSDALEAAFRKSGFTKAALCREAGLSAPTLDNWLAGRRLPVQASTHLVTGVEAALELSPGTLAKRLPLRRRPRYARSPEVDAEARPMTTYGRRIKRNRAAREKKEPLRLPPTPRLRLQWEELVSEKTNYERNGGGPRNTWRTRPPAKAGMRPKWYMVCDGAVVPTASVHYGMVMGYLGFLRLPAAEGGMAIQEPVDTVAWLVHAEHVIQYVKWVRQRADGLLHNGLFTIVQNFMSHLRPETGYVWLRPELSKTLTPHTNESVSHTGWTDRCARAHRALGDYLRRLHRQGKPERSRNPRELIQEVLANDFPLKELIRVVRNLEHDPPPTCQKRNYATWIRDVLLLKMLCRHPLRANHFAVMTFRGSASNLVRSGGTWRLQFEVGDLKNHLSSAASPYLVGFDGSLSKWLDRYLTEARPLMLGAATCDYLFLPSRLGNRGETDPEVVDTGVWHSDNMYARVKSLTAMYSSSGIGLSIHAFRHVPATDHLLRNPGDYLTVAKMLNDKLETVLREYDHTEIQDGIRTLLYSVQKAEAELDERR